MTLVKAICALAAAVLPRGIHIDEAGRSYYYEDIVYKRWEIGDGGRSGNCEDCIENADVGEIEESEFFPADGADGPVDEPPLHPHCTCTVFYRDSRKRVYV